MASNQVIPAQFTILISLFEGGPTTATATATSTTGTGTGQVSGEIRNLVVNELIEKEPKNFIKYNFGFILKQLHSCMSRPDLISFVLNDIFPNLITSCLAHSDFVDRETTFNVVAASLEGVAVLFDVYTQHCVLFLANSYKLVFRVLAAWPSESAKYWLILSVLKQRIDQGFDHGNEALRQVCVYFLAQMVICQSGDNETAAEDEDDEEDYGASLKMVSRSHPYMKKDQLKMEAAAVLNRFLLFLSKTEEKPCTASYLCAVLNATFSIIRKRSQFAVPCTTLLVELRAKSLGYLSDFGMRSVYRSLKVVLLSCYSLPSTSSLDDAIEQVLLGFNVHPRELQVKQRLKRQGRQKVAAAAAGVPRFSEPLMQPPQLPLGDEGDLGLQILQRGVHTFPLESVVEIVVRAIGDRDEMVLQGDIERFLALGGAWDANYRAPGRHATGKTEAPMEQVVEEEEEAMVAVDLDIQAILNNVPVLSPSDRPVALKSTLDRILQMDSILESRLLVKSIRGGINGGIGRDTCISARMGWMLLVSRLVRRGLLPTSQLVGNEDENSEMFDAGRVIIAFCMQDFHKRMDLALFWMFEEFMSDAVVSASSEMMSVDVDESVAAEAVGKHKGYQFWLAQLLRSMKGGEDIGSGLDVRDRVFTRFLVEVPMLDQFALEFVRDYCLDPKRLQLGVATLRDLITYRPAVRDTCLAWLFEFSANKDPTLRSHSCTALKKFVSHESIGALVEERAKQSISTLFVGSLIKLEHEADPESPMAKNEILSHMELYLSLALAKPVPFIQDLFEMSPRLRKGTFAVLEQVCGTLFTTVPPADLLPLVSGFPDTSRDLALVLINTLLKNQDVAAEVIEKTRIAMVERDLDARFLKTIIIHLDKNNVLKHIGKIVDSLDGSEEATEMVKNVFISLVQVKQGVNDEHPTSVVSPADLLVKLHQLTGIKLKKALAATNICFSLPDLFKQEVLAIVLSQLEQSSKLPQLFMRSVLESLKAHSGLSSFINGLLSRLVSKQIWKERKLWEGYVKAVVKTFPNSLPILLALPKQFALDILKQSSDLCQDLSTYLMQLPTHQQKRREVGVLSSLVAEASR